VFLETENIVQKVVVIYFKDVLRNSHPMGTGALFPGVNRPEREADHSPTAFEVKKTSTPPYVCMT
jgi:hypothetical protein